MFCLVKLPGLLARTDMPEKNLSVLLEQINIFLRYVANYHYTTINEVEEFIEGRVRFHE